MLRAAHMTSTLLCIVVPDFFVVLLNLVVLIKLAVVVCEVTLGPAVVTSFMEICNQVNGYLIPVTPE